MEIVNAMLAHPTEWILADQVLFEFYKALRHPGILQRPRSAAQAAAHVRILREQSGVLCCSYGTSLFTEVLAQFENPRFPYQRTHDAILGATLCREGVKVFYTRNEKDFADSGIPKVINPID